MQNTVLFSTYVQKYYSKFIYKNIICGWVNFSMGRYFSNNAKNQNMQNTVLFITYVQKYYLAMLWDTNNEWVEWQDEMQNNDEDKIWNTAAREIRFQTWKMSAKFRASP